MLRVSSIVLNRSGKSRYPCPISSLRGIAFYLSLLNMLLAVGFPQMPSIGLRKVIPIPSLLGAFVIYVFYSV